MSITRDDLEQKFMLCSDLVMKASILGLCVAEAAYSPKHSSFNVSIRPADTVDFHCLIHLVVFADFYDGSDLDLLDQRDVFVLDSAIAFLQCMIDSKISLLNSRVSEVQEAA